MFNCCPNELSVFSTAFDVRQVQFSRPLMRENNPPTSSPSLSGASYRSTLSSNLTLSPLRFCLSWEPLEFSIRCSFYWRGTCVLFFFSSPPRREKTESDRHKERVRRWERMREKEGVCVREKEAKRTKRWTERKAIRIIERG